MPDKSKVFITRCQDYQLDNVREALKRSLEYLGGLKRFVKKNDRVLVKPNLLSAREPERAVTTHPSLVLAVIEEVKKLGGIPFIGDSPGGTEKGIERLWKNTGMAEVSEKTGAELLSFEKEGVYRKETSSGKTYFIAKPALDFDVIISLPKLKTHTLTLLTCGIKNMFGVIPGFRKGEYHKEAPGPRDFAEVVVDIFSLVKPHLNIVDAVVCMSGDGPASGNPTYLGIILASEDAVALDSVTARIYGFKDGEIDTTNIASERGLGRGDLSQIEILGDDLPDFSMFDLKLPSNRFLRLIPKFLVKLLAPYIWVRPAILDGNCTNCNVCVENCPVKTIYPGDPTPVYDYKNCINCMCCHELCPHRAVYLEKSWLSRRIGR
ncbi:MAG: hypothetical protein AMJ90_00885 [candidate division Zixibacteria bacterium SM23_73_2]|nr:MAG: hypothetical protein AMJ90_00885 [candidate division Zixibacteria bacterium SM23_73_2]